MAQFEQAIGGLLEHEGGYVDDPQDSGGATNWGISTRWLKENGMGSVDVKSLTREEASELYKLHFWSYTGVENQAVANKLLDMAVNLGIQTAHILLQNALNRLGKGLIVDGILGPKTLKAVNSVAAADLLRELRAEQALRYVRIVLANPTQAKFINGWIRRAVA